MAWLFPRILSNICYRFLTLYCFQKYTITNLFIVELDFIRNNKLKWIVNQVLLTYTTLPFVVIEWNRSLEIWRSFGFSLHVAMLTILLLL
jgi:hypothetical protein